MSFNVNILFYKSTYKYFPNLPTFQSVKDKENVEGEYSKIYLKALPYCY